MISQPTRNPRAKILLCEDFSQLSWGVTRAEFFRAVILKSLKKRWSWLFGLPVLVFIGLMVFKQPFWFSAVLALVLHLLLTGYSAWASYQRHRHEYIS